MDYEVKLEIFEGPLDLLLHLIHKNEVDIFDIPIATITDQYLEYLDMMNVKHDWEETLKLLLEKGYRGPWLIEVLNGGNDPFDVLAQMGDSITKMRAMLEELSRR